MKHKEYIIPIGEEAKEFDEMFIGVIRKQPELIRCKDCKWYAHCDDCYGDCMKEGAVNGFVYTNDYCSRAERKDG